MEDNEVRSEEGGTSEQAHLILVKKTAERLPISSSFTVFYSCLKPVMHNFKIFIGFRDHYELSRGKKKLIQAAKCE